jgi:hypothetical protein
MDKQETAVAIYHKCLGHGLDLADQIAYILATVEWETAGTFKPVREAYWHDEAWREKHLRYYPYYGRGYVQLTWEDNYRRYGERLGIDLVNEPDLALDPEIAAFILVDGFKVGFFTGKKLEDYINEEDTDFIEARRCINGQDHAAEIAALAEKWWDWLYNLKE